MPAQATSLLLPPDSLYFAVLEPDSHTTALRSRRRRENALRFMFEDCLPCNVEQLHIVFRPVGDGRILACGAEHGALCEAVTKGRATVTPSELPGFVRDAAPKLEPRNLNLLVGRHEPLRARRLRRVTRWIHRTAVVLVVVLASIGLERRRIAYSDFAARAGEATSALVSAVLPQQLGPSAIPPQARLTAALRAARQSSDAAARLPVQRNAATTLQRLLERWPRDLHTRTELICVTLSGITVTTTTADHEEARKFVASVDGLTGWRLQQPQITSGRDGTQVRLHYLTEGAPQ